MWNRSYPSPAMQICSAMSILLTSGCCFRLVKSTSISMAASRCSPKSLKRFQEDLQYVSARPHFDTVRHAADLLGRSRRDLAHEYRDGVSHSRGESDADGTDD